MGFILLLLLGTAALGMSALVGGDDDLPEADEGLEDTGAQQDAEATQPLTDILPNPDEGQPEDPAVAPEPGTEVIEENGSEATEILSFGGGTEEDFLNLLSDTELALYQSALSGFLAQQASEAAEADPLAPDIGSGAEDTLAGSDTGTDTGTGTGDPILDSLLEDIMTSELGDSQDVQDALDLYLELMGSSGNTIIDLTSTQSLDQQAGDQIADLAATLGWSF